MIGIKQYDNKDVQIMQFYIDNYDVLRTPDFKDTTRFLKPEHGLKYLGNIQSDID